MLYSTFLITNNPIDSKFNFEKCVFCYRCVYTPYFFIVQLLCPASPTLI